MQIVGALKKAYFFFEDKYYGVLDKIDKYVPVYKVLDPIDKVFPSFILFVSLMVCLLILLAFMTLPHVVLSATLKVVDEDKAVIEGVSVTVSFLISSIFCLYYLIKSKWKFTNGSFGKAVLRT